MIALAVAVSTIVLLAYFHNLNTTYQKRINSTTQQLERQKTQQREQLEKTLHESQQKNADQQKQIDDLNQQLSLKKENARLASARATQTTQTTQGASSGNCDAYRGLLASYAWNTDIAMAVMKAESGCNPTASSPTHDHGLMQINEVHLAKVNYHVESLNDPETNVRVAFEVYSGAGWRAWSTYTNGAYQRFL